MDITNKRVVEFRRWAERRFGIGSGPYPEGEDLLSVVMFAVDERERQWQEAACDSRTPENSPDFIRYLYQACRLM
jgi:hypothetical protein